MLITIKKIKKKTLEQNSIGILNQCKQKQSTSLIYITKNCKLCFLYLYDRLLNLCSLLEMHYESIKTIKKEYICPKS